MPKADLPIVIAGAGPAGSTLAIRLRKLGLPVVLIERYEFPRHKLCGEFISPECLSHFAELGVLDEMLSAGGDRVFETRFFEAGGRSVNVPSRWFGKGQFALSLSRARMDQILFEAAKAVGTECLDQTLVTGLIGESGHVGGVRVRHREGDKSEIPASIVVDATGRARVLSRFADKITGTVRDVKPEFVGFKAHLTNVEIPHGLCEIYGFAGGYGGLSFIEGEEANLCFLARASLLKEHNDAGRMADQLISQNARAAQTLRNARNAHEWLAVSVPAFGANRMPRIAGLYSIGDSAAFIDPFTGSGMLMAMESAGVFADCIANSGSDHKQLRPLYLKEYRRRFKSRLRISGVLRRVACEPALARATIRCLSVSDRLRANLARRTRSTSSADPV